MVLDTRWKKFKYSKASKALCVVLALIMAAVFASNGFALLKCYEFLSDEDFINTEGRSFYGSRLMDIHLNWDISTVFDQVTRNADLKEYYAAETQYVEKAMELYKKEEAKNRLTDEDIEKYTKRLSDSYSHDFSKYPDLNGYDINYYLNAYYNIYKGDDGNWYKTDFDYESMVTASYVSGGHLNFGHSDARAQELLKKHFYNVNYNSYVSDDYFAGKISLLENFRFYGENIDGTVFTNVEDGKGFVSRIEKGEGDYIVYENDELRLSESLEELREILWSRETSGSRIYITLNTDFTGNDKYGVLFSEYNKIADVDVAQTVTVMAISLLAVIALAVISVRLAGHTEDGISISFIDKLPQDLHFAITSGLVFLSGAGIYALLTEFFEIMPYYNPSNRYPVETMPFISSLMTVGIVALACVIYLLILEFATSIARSVKAERPIIKKTAVFLIFANLFKFGGKGIIAVLKFIFVTVIGGFFRLIGKGIRKLLHLCKLLVLKPKRLERKLVSATAWYTLFNLVSFIIITVFFMITYDYGGEEYILYGILWFFALIAFDIYLIYRAVKYLKALDDIIDTSAKREPLPYDAATLPPSLKTLAQSLEATNAELQEAVLKAVKDERTKAELITNVSHDLKTPLTSVINYIDLLQKCDIEDETARQYMVVIDEKSARLKRLIEDLIEASKVSTGNVTLNKTKLNLNELASQAIVEETSDIEKNNLQIIFEEASNKHIVYADGTKIYRVFENLLSNARKYSAPYSRIYARVYSDGDSGCFEIKNISKDPLNITAEELTERFVRGDKSRSEEGNGLGLSIARELCKLNGGDLIISIDGDLFKATVKLPKQENQTNNQE